MMPITHSPSTPRVYGDNLEDNITDTQRLSEWQAWQQAAPPGRGEQRKMAVDLLKMCLENRRIFLDLSYLGLRELPPRLPDCIETLNIDNNNLTAISVPLPDGLEELSAINNRLTHLPATLPACLKYLYVLNNQLMRLPDQLPPSLVMLCASHNQLTSLPENLPNSLDVLVISNNLLTRLPDALPLSLDILRVTHNQLTALPEDLPHLTELHVNHNQLTGLPAQLPRSLVILNIHNNPLPEPLELMGFNRFNINSQLSSELDFLDKLFCWNRHIDSRQWEKIQHEDNAMAFVDFLKNLHQEKNSHNVELKSRISRWLNYLAEDDHQELRRLTFVVAKEVTEGCVDRASFYFTKMHILMVEHQLVKTAAPLEAVVETILGLFRLQVLEQIAADKVAERRLVSPGFTEDLEIYLAYQCLLQTRLSLPIYTEIQFADLADVSRADIEQAYMRVIEQEKREFLRYWFTESALWTAILTKWDEQKKALMEARYLDDISSRSFKHAIMQALDEKKMSLDDSDAERTVSSILATTLLYQYRAELTRECLESWQALSLLDRFSGYHQPSVAAL